MATVTDFGRAVREARDATNETLKTMAQGTGKSVAFLSAIETGRSKVPLDFVQAITDFFSKRGYSFDKEEVLGQELLKKLAQAQNNEVVMTSDLPLQQKMLIAGFASSPFNRNELEQLTELFNHIYKDRATK